ncbi:MAG: glycosyltransferase family 2 protein [Erysipelotrichaceae bacterium]|nr:glycosyltransferase family 2 protein [Erysipelotrichaceae bacterium]
MRLSIVIPCFNEAEVLNLFMEKTSAAVKTIKEKYDTDTEYIFVNDGSKDATLEILKGFHEKDPSVHYISFSRNFGKEAALLAGLKASDSEFTAIMDADLQDPPELLIDMIDVLIHDRADCAAARRMNRDGEPVIRSFFARRFYALINRSKDPDLAEGVRDFRMMNRSVLDAVLSISEYNRFSKGIFAWVGFRTEWIPYEHTERAAGRTKWSFSQLAHYGIDGIIGYTVKPLEIAAWIGVFFFMLSMAGIIFIIVRKLLFGDPVAGWPSLVCIMLFCSGIQLFCTGIIGEYLAKTYLEVKNRPVYIIQESDRVLRKL